MGQWLQAARLLKEMQGHTLQPNEISYNTAILSCADGQQFDMMFSLLDDMIARELEPDALTYSRLLTECEYGGMLGREAALLTRFAGRGSGPSSSLLLPLV